MVITIMMTIMIEIMSSITIDGREEPEMPIMTKLKEQEKIRHQEKEEHGTSS